MQLKDLQNVKIETITTPDDFTQYSERGGFVDLEIGVRIPNSYYEAVKEYCNIAKIPVREWFNNEIILGIEALELGFVTKIFLEKYHLRELSSDKGWQWFRPTKASIYLRKH